MDTGGNVCPFVLSNKLYGDNSPQRLWNQLVEPYTNVNNGTAVTYNYAMRDNSTKGYKELAGLTFIKK